jgi:hypothetical protein
VTLAERFGNPLRKKALARAYDEMREVDAFAVCANGICRPTGQASVP